jgi:choline-sulfatase
MNQPNQMTRREILKAAALAVPIVGISSHALAAARSDSKQRTVPKNVILFITDQERAIQYFPDGWERKNLPGLTRLKHNGVTFENAFTNACMCSPARSTLMSGYFPAQHGVKYTLEQNMSADAYPQVELPLSLANVATVAAAAGLNPVYKGKWHCSKPADPDGTAVPDDLSNTVLRDGIPRMPVPIRRSSKVAARPRNQQPMATTTSVSCSTRAMFRMEKKA